MRDDAEMAKIRAYLARRQEQLEPPNEPKGETKYVRSLKAKVSHDALGEQAAKLVPEPAPPLPPRRFELKTTPTHKPRRAPSTPRLATDERETLVDFCPRCFSKWWPCACGDGPVTRSREAKPPTA